MKDAAPLTPPSAWPSSPRDAAAAAWRSRRSASRSSRRCSARRSIRAPTRSLPRSVRREHPHISLATVHRTLETLCDIGEARKVTTLHDSARYDGNITPASSCGMRRNAGASAISRFPSLNGCSRAPELGEFTLLGASLEIHALCEECGEKRARANRTGKPRDRFL